MTESKRNGLPSVVIFGASQAGLAAYQHLQDDYAVIGFCDNDVAKQGEYLNGIEIFAPQDLSSLSLECIFIASEYAEAIYTQLQSMALGISVQILPARLIKFMHFQDNAESSQLAIKILHLVCKFLEQNSIQYYVDAGTLLGIIRDGALIPWDDDLDIAIHSGALEQTRKNIHLLLEQLSGLTGETWQHSEQINTQVFGVVPKDSIRAIKLFSAQHDSKLPMLDFFIKYIDGQWMDYCLSSRGIRMPALHFDKTDNIEFSGQTLKIPAQVESYLVRHYGADWRIPKKDWNLSDLQNATVF